MNWLKRKPSANGLNLKHEAVQTVVLDRARLQQRKIKLDRGTSSSSSRSMNNSLSVGNQFDQGMIEGLFSEASNASQDDTAEMLKIEGGLYIYAVQTRKSQ